MPVIWISRSIVRDRTTAKNCAATKDCLYERIFVQKIDFCTEQCLVLVPQNSRQPEGVEQPKEIDNPKRLPLRGELFG